MRLIDADKLIEDIEKEIQVCDKNVMNYKNDDIKLLAECSKRQNLFEIKHLIYNQPTAFDVGKVVKKLERKSKIHDIVANSKNDLVNAYASACYEDTIEIVKAGGIDEKN